MIMQGHVLDILSTLPEDSVDCVVTSPPYWGLRDYKIEPQVWDAQAGCEHEWGETQGQTTTQWADGIGNKGDTLGDAEIRKARRISKEPCQGQFCLRCGAWRGSLGLEPTPELFVKHIVQVFAAVRRVLKPSGVCFVNLGDSYAQGQGKHSSDEQAEKLISEIHEQGYGGGGLTGWAGRRAVKTATSGLKPKDLCGIPWRCAFALQADGWWLRSDIIWSKPNPMPESVTDRPTKSHEYIFLLTKSAKYFWNQEAIKEGCNEQNIGRRRGTDSKVPDGSTDFLRTRAGLKNGQGRRYATRNTRTVWEYDEEECKTTVYMDSGNPNFEKSEGTTLFRTISPEFEVVVDKMDDRLWAWWLDFFVKRVGKTDEEYTAKDRRNLRRFRICQKGIPTDIIKIATEPTPEAHFATFPQELVKRCILAGCPDNGTVLDPFIGSGTTGIVSENLYRKWIGIELNPEYIKIAEKRLKTKANIDQFNWLKEQNGSQKA